jgi:hypothetical protein
MPQRLRHLAGTHITLGGLARHRTRGNRRQRRRHLGLQFVRRPCGAGKHGLRDLVQRRAVDGPAAAQQLVQHDAQRVDVSARVDR